MRVLVTGAGGFIGRHVVAGLAGRGTAVIAVDAALTAAGAMPGTAAAINGDLGDPALRAAALRERPDAVIHLAALPGGAAEADPLRSQAVNLEATLALQREALAQRRGLRWVQASTIAVLGEPLPAAGVDDSTPPAPRLVYGMHKAMIETAVGTFSRRGDLDGLSLRLPGVVARPRASAGLKSAFMSDVFHALAANEGYVVPVAPAATVWLASVERIASLLIQALEVDTTRAPPDRALTAPALHVRVDDLVGAIAAATGGTVTHIDYRPDAALQSAFGAYPPLVTAAAERLGFGHPENLGSLVESALGTLH